MSTEIKLAIAENLKIWKLKFIRKAHVPSIHIFMTMLRIIKTINYILLSPIAESAKDVIMCGDEIKIGFLLAYLGSNCNFHA